jgi:hypothetical protein
MFLKVVKKGEAYMGVEDHTAKMQTEHRLRKEREVTGEGDGCGEEGNLLGSSSRIKEVGFGGYEQQFKKQKVEKYPFGKKFKKGTFIP